MFVKNCFSLECDCKKKKEEPTEVLLSYKLQVVFYLSFYYINILKMLMS